VAIPGVQISSKVRARGTLCSYTAHPVWAKRTPPVSITQFASMLSMDQSLTSIECVAELVKKPLISLTSSDLGTEPEAVEQRLLRWFDLANVWNAVLLIDEADVFLERRSSSDLRRNNLVVIFLRTLEYYRGILFLTTNRVGTFDEAFLSRIDVAVYFPPLSSESRVRLWSTFISKLENERRGEIRVGTDFKSYIRNDRDLLNLQLNGREIRSSAFYPIMHYLASCPSFLHALPSLVPLSPSRPHIPHPDNTDPVQASKQQ
jgi:hypothetical protein